MKWLNAVSGLSTAIIMTAALSGCAGSATRESTGGYIDDTVITAKVKSALLTDKTVRSTEIGVETFKGRVQLSGFVSSESVANRAVEVTRAVRGVRVVENDMKVK